MLKPDERKLLMDNNGCFKCQLFNQSHSAINCPNDFPDGNKYKKITAYHDASGNALRKSGKGSSSKDKLSLRLRLSLQTLPLAQMIMTSSLQSCPVPYLAMDHSLKMMWVHHFALNISLWDLTSPWNT
jgi:hypothetical protein